MSEIGDGGRWKIESTAEGQWMYLITHPWGRPKVMNMKDANLWVSKAIAELRPATEASCPNELAMRTVMALIRLNNAFQSAFLRPLLYAIPCEDAGKHPLREVQWTLFPTEDPELDKQEPPANAR